MLLVIYIWKKNYMVYFWNYNSSSINIILKKTKNRKIVKLNVKWCETVPYWPKTGFEKPHFFIFSDFPTEKTEKKGGPTFIVMSDWKVGNWEFEVFHFGSIRNGLTRNYQFWYQNTIGKRIMKYRNITICDCFPCFLPWKRKPNTSTATMGSVQVLENFTA